MHASNRDLYNKGCTLQQGITVIDLGFLVIAYQSNQRQGFVFEIFTNYSVFEYFYSYSYSYSFFFLKIFVFVFVFVLKFFVKIFEFIRIYSLFAASIRIRFDILIRLLLIEYIYSNYYTNTNIYSLKKTIFKY